MGKVVGLWGYKRVCRKIDDSENFNLQHLIDRHENIL